MTAVILLTGLGMILGGCGKPLDGFYRLRGDAFRHADEPGEALRWYNRIPSNRCSEELLISMAECYDDLAAYTNLLETYQRLYEVSQDKTYLKMLVLVHDEYEDSRGAIETLRKLITLEPEQWDYRQALFFAMLRSSQSNEIPELLTDYEEAAGDDSTNILFVSMLWSRAGELSNAVQLARQAVKAAPSNTEWRMLLTEVLVEGGHFKEAATNAARLAAAEPDNADILQLQGYIYNERGDSSNAIRCFRLSLKHDQRNVLALNNLAYLLLTENRDITEGLELALSAVQQERTAVTLDTLAYAYYRRGAHEVALRYLEEAEGLMMRQQAQIDPEIDYHFGLVYAEMGQMHKALPRFRAALRGRPELEQLLKLERYYQTLKPRLSQ